MKTVKSLYPLSTWAMRIGIAFFVYAKFSDIVFQLNFNNFSFYIALLFVVFGFLLFVGGFIKKSSLTMISSLVLLFLSIYKIILLSSTVNISISIYILILSISLLFLSKGNN